MSRRNEKTSAMAFAVGVCLFCGTALLVFGSVVPQVTRVEGKVTMKQADGTEANGKRLAIGDTVPSDSGITTAKGSSAVVSLGKLGRVEVFPSTKMNLKYNDTSITAMLDAGRVRVSSSSGVNATASTKDGEVVTNSTEATEFTVDTTCGNTVVSVQSGQVELRAGNSVKQIAAGNQDTAGQAKPGRCPRS